MTFPELAVKQSGYGGRGYAIPALPGEDSKKVKADGGYVQTRVDGDGKAIIVPSVTTVLKAGSSDALVQWAVDQTAGYAAINPDSVFTRSPDAAFGYLRFYWRRTPDPLEEGFELRNYHRGVLQEAADLGTSIHEWMQADAGDGEYPDVSTKNESFFEMVVEWNKWYAENFVEPVFTEATVYNSELGYAGTLDCLWRINGELWLLDMKSSRGLWPDHSRQLAALKEADTLLLKDESGEWTHQPWQPWVDQIDRYGFLHIRPSDIDKDGEFMLPYLEVVDAENLDVHFEAFKGLLAVKHAEREIKRREQEEK